MAIKNYNIPPYYDDFDQTKNYLRILFRPGYAVQARELTQLQTAIQAQIDRFGSHVFKEGSPVLGGQASLDTNYDFVKLENQFTDGGNTYYPEGDGGTNLSYYLSAVGTTIHGVDSGIDADVLQATPTVSSTLDPLTIFVRYRRANSSGGTAGTFHQFLAGEILTFTVNGTVKKFKVKASGSNPIGKGTRVSVSEGVYFVKGNFVYTPEDSILVSKYTTNPSARVVYKISENIITSAEDASLVDNSIGTPNQSAPGAHRYQVAMDLVVEPYSLASRTEDNIIQLLLINGGQVTGRARTEYSELARTLATRTYEESGNYTVRPFQINVREYYNNGSNGGLYNVGQIQVTNPSFTEQQAIDYGKARLAVGLEPSVAYVNGYRVETLDTTYIPVEKARDEAYTNNASLFAPLGGYIYVDTVVGLPDTVTFSKIDLKNSATTGLVATLSTGTATVTLTTGSTVNMAVGQVLTKTSGTGAFGSSPVVASIISSTQFTVNVNHATAGSITFDAEIAVIGKARARAMEYVSGTVGSAAFYKLYLFDIAMNSGQSLSNVKYLLDSSVPGYDFTATANDVDPLINDTILYDPSNSSLIYKLPVSAVQSLRSSNDTCDFIYYVRRKFGIVTSGSVVSGVCQLTLTGSNSQGSSEYFYSTTSTDYIVVNANTGSQVTQSANPSIGGNGLNVTLTLPSGSANTDFYVLAPTRRNKTEKVKTFVSGAPSSPGSKAIAVPNTQPGLYDLLDQTDVLRIKAVYMSADTSTPATVSDTNITGRYILDDGQRENFYDVARIQLKPGSSAPTGSILVIFDYFTHSPGDYFGVNSYSGVDYGDIPSFNSIKGTIPLRDAVDFRPTKSNDGTGEFVGAGSSTTDCVAPNSTILTDIQFYIPRIDKIFVNKNGEFGAIKGISGVIPKTPEDPEDSMVLYSINLNAYTFSTIDLSAKMVDNKRYTMRDIGRLEKRISNVEYYTSLSLLEKSAANSQILDGSGNQRYKNGFIVDSFVDHGIGALNNPDYHCSIEAEKGILLPEFSQKYVNLVPNIAGSTNIKQTGSLVTLNYTEVPLIDQPYSSYSEFVNPHAFYGWQGRIELSPTSDEWKETTTKPALVANAGSSYSWFPTASEQTANHGVFNNWQISWFGVSPEDEDYLNNEAIISVAGSNQLGQTLSIAATDLNGTLRFGTATPISTGVFSNTQTRQVADTVVDNTVIPYIRSRKVYFKATGLKPYSRVYAFFDGVDISNYVKSELTFNNYTTNPDDKVYTGYTAHPSGASTLITDPSGQLIGSFIIPHNDSLKFRTGERIFRIVDNSLNNTDGAFTYAESTYRATGIFAPAPTPSTQPPVIIATPRPGPPPSTPPFVTLWVQGRTPKYAGIPFNFNVHTAAVGYGSLTNFKVQERSNSIDINLGTWVDLAYQSGDITAANAASAVWRISPALPGTYQVRGVATWGGITYYSPYVTFTVTEVPAELSGQPLDDRFYN